MRRILAGMLVLSLSASTWLFASEPAAQSTNKKKTTGKPAQSAESAQLQEMQKLLKQQQEQIKLLQKQLQQSHQELQKAQQNLQSGVQQTKKQADIAQQQALAAQQAGNSLSGQASEIKATQGDVDHQKTQAK